MLRRLRNISQLFHFQPLRTSTGRFSRLPPLLALVLMQQKLVPLSRPGRYPATVNNMVEISTFNHAYRSIMQCQLYQSQRLSASVVPHSPTTRLSHSATSPTMGFAPLTSPTWLGWISTPSPQAISRRLPGPLSRSVFLVSLILGE